MKNIKTYKSDIWDKNHIINTNDNFVTSTGYNSIAKQHEIPLNPINNLILEIGIGRGAAIKDLSRKNKVIASDISKIAIAKVSCYKACLSKDIKNLEPVDLAFSHLTFQHCAETEVLRIINDINLKDNAIFSFQFASLNLDKTVLSSLIMNDINRAMIYFYSPDKMKSLISLTNKKLVKHIGPLWFGSPFNFEWNIFHVTKS